MARFGQILAAQARLSSRTPRMATLALVYAAVSGIALSL